MIKTGVFSFMVINEEITCVKQDTAQQDRQGLSCVCGYGKGILEVQKLENVVEIELPLQIR